MIADRHPEDLLDRARSGGLDPDAQATLDRHLATCTVCAAQLSLAPRFERELAPQPRDPQLDQRAVEAALRRLQESPPPSAERPRAATSIPRRWLRWAAAAALLATGVTGAAAVIGRRMRSERAPELSAMRSEAPPQARPVARPIEPSPEEVPAPLEAPPPATVPPKRTPARPAATAASLFERGESLRREGRLDDAIGVYRRLQASFPETPEARLSFALAGQLLLKRGRPGDALAQFERHLRLGGAVGEEALAGRATALEQLRRTADAVAAWKSLLALYPDSIYAERARARLEQLNERR